MAYEDLLKPWFLITTQWNLRERDEARSGKSCTFESGWFLNVRRTRVTQGYAAGSAASCGSGIRSLTSARHAGVLWLQGAKARVCWRLLYFIFLMSAFISPKIKWKMSLQTLKNFLKFVSESIKHLPAKLHQYPSSFLVFKMSAALSRTQQTIKSSSSSSSSIMTSIISPMFTL